MQKIRILHIIKSLGRGGAEVLLPETLKLHDSSKFEFHYIYFLPWKDQMVEYILANGGAVTCLPAKNNLNLILKSRKIVEYIEKNKIDLIHCHLPWSGFLGRIVYNRTKVPVIYTEHNIQERYHFATRLLNKYTFNSQSLALGVSNDVTRSIVENIEPTIPVQTLLNGVNVSNFKFNQEKRNEIRDRFQIPRDAFVVGNIAVFRAQKSIPDWLRAFKKALDIQPNIYGLLVGSGPLENEIKGLIKELDLTKNIILPGLQTDTVSYFSAMDVFMMSSAYEGLPIALLEAMSTNCAIISTKAGGVTEVIRHNKDGLLCEVGNWECLGDEILNLAANKAIFENLRFAARNRVVENFSLDNMVEKLEKCYLELLNKVEK